MSNFVLSVMISVVSNIIVVVVLLFRRKRMKAPHWFIVALAISGLTRIRFAFCKKCLQENQSSFIGGTLFSFVPPRNSLVLDP